MSLPFLYYHLLSQHSKISILDCFIVTAKHHDLCVIVYLQYFLFSTIFPVVCHCFYCHHSFSILCKAKYRIFKCKGTDFCHCRFSSSVSCPVIVCFLNYQSYASFLFQRFRRRGFAHSNDDYVWLKMKLKFLFI